MRFPSSDLLAALPRLRRYARILTNDPDLADDLVEKTLSRARQILDKPPLGPSPEMQLFSMLRSLYTDQVAHSGACAPTPRHSTREANSLAGTDSTAPAPGSNADRSEESLTQVFRLSIEQREVLILVAVERMSYQDIATLLAVPVATVLARLTQAREALRCAAFQSQTAPNGKN